MATYNGEKFIKKQIQSILLQLDEEDELIISDDGSEDKTLEVVAGFNDPRIKVFFNNCHGVVYNFENALSKARGDFIFLSDQDDEWLPNKVKKCCKALERYDCIVTDCYVCDGDGKMLHSSFYALNRTRKGRVYNLLIKNGYIGCCMAFRRKILSKVLPFPNDIPLHDLWIGNIAAFDYSLGWMTEKLVKYRRHDSNASCAAGKSDASFASRIGYRWRVIKHLF